ncbi:maleylpyruvate isomerase N-terminal domain-containing protein [Rhizobium sp. L1K21]|uniref:maleylpyruvate isomerase N-terminal domain-containing protein n=1 Tax=Rhizobium sp. L1K21 TaxID=2954933 RepID=UPI002093015F|nr:maleylpyruvate isomerase N-terminal domain-containing protein [Rhizobium sp. L1K21]MCO6188517.1 maleylpyruvate isomerase N-terminal domain-containing protein [Rhizobium sp. L1K21]
MIESDERARLALRARQGAGARYDAKDAPAETLLLARRGTAYFARKLNELPDGEFVLPSGRDGWTRAMLIAYVGLHARALASMIEAARTANNAVPLVFPAERDLQRIRTLSPTALRHLFDHSAKHLDVEWRDLSDAGWNCKCTMPGQMALSETPLKRAQVLWNAGALIDGRAQKRELFDCRQEPNSLFSLAGEAGYSEIFKVI